MRRAEGASRQDGCGKKGVKDMENEDDKLGPKGPCGTPGDRGKPGDESRVVADAGQDGREAAETKPTADETKPAEVKENAAPEKGKRDWVKEAYECFVKNAVDSDPTDPVKAIAAYFEKNATDELKAKAKAEGKTAEGCWKFIEAVARKALGGRSGHIDPVTVYAIAMHYFQDVPALADFEPKLKAAEEKVRKANLEKKYKENQEKHNAEVRAKAAKKAAKTRKKNAKAGTNAKIEALKEKIPQAGSVSHQQELKEKLKAEKAKLKGQKPKKGGKEQGFFFDLLETETASPAGEGGVAC